MTDWRDILVWRRLAECVEAQPAAASIDTRDAAAIARLRKRWDADLVAAALELAEARRKAAGKFEDPSRLWCDVAGVEQASGAGVAAWKARRMRESLGAEAAILDVCCGVGGDAMALAAAGLQVTAVDLDARRAWMAGCNAGCETLVADAESLSLAGVALHADPARRDERGGRRSWSLEDHQPGRAWIERAMREARAAAIKFSPGVDRREFGDIPIEWEFIEEGARLVQAVAWCGAFARDPGATRATRISDGAGAGSVSTISGPPRACAYREGALAPGVWISEPAPALERADLLAHAAGPAATEIAPGLGLLASEAPLPSPWFEGFRFVEECPARAEAVLEALQRHGLAARSVRVRGKAVDADAMTRAIRARPDGDAVVFAFRRGVRATAAIARLA